MTDHVARLVEDEYFEKLVRTPLSPEDLDDVAIAEEELAEEGTVLAWDCSLHGGECTIDCRFGYYIVGEHYGHSWHEGRFWNKTLEVMDAYCDACDVGWVHRMSPRRSTSGAASPSRVAHYNHTLVKQITRHG
ncbi:hypothetical protein [Kineococcus terrestris]|uniref:hypothetical protein n=1 Tax=Kineococcus terrestris TaxID=2044856 RepID=UPI0034DAEDB4